MKSQARWLFAIGISVPCLLGFSASSFALGLPDPLHYDMGVLGQWDVSGGVDGWGSVWNNNAGTAVGVGGGGSEADVSLGNAETIFNKTDGQLQFTVWVGVPPNTLVMGLNSVNDGANNLYALGSKRNPFAGSPLFKGYATYQPVDWFSVQAGRLPSPDGTEIGIDWFNPTVWVSDLNNMQTTTADGGQVNFIAPWKSWNGSTLTIRLADGYKTGHVNELGFTGLYNINADGSDYVVAFGHTRFSRVGNPVNFHGSANFGTANANLIGIGGAWVLGKWTISPEAEYQWLPKDILDSSTISSHPLTTYYNVAGQVTVTYQFTDQWALSGQVQYINQHGNRADPNDDAFGNFLGLGSSGAPGAIGAGANMFGIQINPTWQYHNFFVRPAVAYTRLTNFTSGDGYGKNGTTPDQFVGLVEVGFLFGQIL